MRRRTFLQRSAAGAGFVSLAGCGGGSSQDLALDAEAPAPRSYSTSFNLSETPLVEDGHWRQGGRDGRQWQDVKSGGGLAHGVAISPSGYNDCVACRDNVNNSKHTVVGRVHKDPAYTPPGNPEIELVAGVTIEPDSIRLYEFLWSHAGAWQIVRWNGPMGSFNFSLPVSGPGPGVSTNGDVMELGYDATNSAEVILTCYKNGVLVATARDSTPGRILSGNPGLSFFARSGTNADMNRYCFSQWSCSA